MSDADPARCPLCRGPNACRLAERSTADAGDCWCRAEGFPEALLARVPSVDRGRSCICRSCLEAARHPTADGRA